MGNETPEPESEQGDEHVVAEAISLDRALVEGRDPLAVMPAENPEDGEAIEAVRASLLMLERVWPRSEIVTPLIPGAGAAGAMPASFGRFKILREVGRGGFGVVFQAIDPELGRHVALKIPRAEVLLDPVARQRFVREGCAAACLDHPNLVPLYESGEVESVCYLATAFCEGPTLAAWLRDRRDPVVPEAAAKILAALASAIQHAHERGVLHRDLKPSNILLQRIGAPTPGLDAEAARAPGRVTTGDESAPIPRVIDFGLAKLMDQDGEELTASFAAMGSAPFMAPEQVEGKKVGAATDIYGLGAILYAILCNRPPHRGVHTPDTLRRVVADEPVLPRQIRPQIPRDLEAICLKCLEKDPSRRYPSAADLSDDIRRFLVGERVKARPVSAPTRAWRRLRRRPATLALVGLAVTVTLAALIGARWYNRQLEIARVVAREKENELRLRDAEIHEHLTTGRKNRYVADMLLAAQFVETHQTVRALELLDRNRPGAGESDLREFAWHLLLRSCHNERIVLQGHRGDVYHAEFSPDGRQIATAGEDGTIRLWDAVSGRQLLCCAAHDTEVNWVAFSPDGKSLATIGDDGFVKLRRSADGVLIWEKLVHKGEGSCVFFEPDGKTLLSGGRLDSVVKILDAARGTELAAFEALDHRYLEGAALSADGLHMAVAGKTTVNVWDVRRRVRVASAQCGSVLQGVAMTHDGKILAIAGEGGAVLLWDWRASPVPRQICYEEKGAFAIAFTRDDTNVAWAGIDPKISVANAASGVVRSILLGHTEKVWGLSTSPDGNSVVSASHDGTARVWDIQNDRIRTVLPTTAPGAFAFSRDGRTLTFIGKNSIVSTWELSAGTRRVDRQLDGQGANIEPVLDADGSTAAIVTKDGFIEIWDLAGWRVKGKYKPTLNRPESLIAFDRRTGFLGFNTKDSSQIVDLSTYEVTSRNRLFRFFSPEGDAYLDGERFMTRLSADGRYEETIRELRTPTSGYFSFDGKLLVAFDGSSRSLMLWSWNPLKFVADLQGHARDVTAAAFSRNNRTLACGDTSGVVKLWDISTGKELLTLDQHTGSIGQIEFSPDDRILAVHASSEKPGETASITLWHTLADDSPAHPESDTARASLRP